MAVDRRNKWTKLLPTAAGANQLASATDCQAARERVPFSQRPTRAAGGARQFAVCQLVSAGSSLCEFRLAERLESECAWQLAPAFDCRRAEQLRESRSRAGSGRGGEVRTGSVVGTASVQFAWPSL